MHYFVAEISQLDVPSLTASSRRAEAIYDENLVAYIKIVFRRPFGKIIVSTVLTAIGLVDINNFVRCYRISLKI
jgi:hypothetical protein